MIKQILDFIKNLFSSTKPEEPVAPAPKLNTEATWPFPTSDSGVNTVNLNTMAGDYTINLDAVSASDITIDLSTESVPVKKAESTAPKNRKKRNIKKSSVQSSTPAVKVEAPAEFGKPNPNNKANKRSGGAPTKKQIAKQNKRSIQK